MLMKTRQWITVAALLTLVAFGIAGLVLTRDTGQPVAAEQARAGKDSKKTPSRPPLVDERPLQTARSLAALAATPEEQQLAHQALKVADHEVDLAFADALRRATEQPVQLTPEIKELYARESKAEAAVESDLTRTASSPSSSLPRATNRRTICKINWMSPRRNWNLTRTNWTTPGTTSTALAPIHGREFST